MTKFLLLHRAAAPPHLAADLDGELIAARQLADPSLAVVVGADASAAGPVTAYWLVDVDTLDRAVQIAAATGGPVEVRELMHDGPGPEL